MKFYLSFILIFLNVICSAQRLKVEPYTFISKNNDTVAAELGKFKVLENRSNTRNDSIDIAFIRFKSTSDNPGNPILYLAGGPGGSGSEAARGNRFSLFMKLREIADVIAFDQRGTGLSHKLINCPYNSEFEVNKPLNKSVYVEKTITNIEKCVNFWNSKNVDLRAYNTTENANDIEELRQLLGTAKISLWGISYGTHLAFEYIRHYENNLDKIVLASLEGPNETIKLPVDTEDFIFKIADRAEDNYGATPKYPYLQEKIIEVHKRLKAEPVITSYKNRRGIVDTVGISNFELQATIATFYLKNPNDSKKLPKLYSEMYVGDFSNIAAKVVIMKKYVLNSISAMPFSMDMQSSISSKRRRKVENQIETKVLGSAINFLLFEWMQHIDFYTLSTDFRVQNKNSVDALLLSGTLDGRTYVNSGIEISKKFNNGSIVIVDNAGHDLFMASPQIGEMILDFFKGKKILSQTIELQPINFD